MISLHGLVRGNDLELGKDPDTGGQVKVRTGSPVFASDSLASDLVH